MRRLIFILLLSVMYSVSSVASVWHNFNVDATTISAMGATYAKEGVVELDSKTKLDSILSHYTKSTVATGGIFLAKKYEHDSRKDVRLFANEEFWYYKTIYNLVKDGIMPRVINVTCLFVQEPKQIFFWGPYLFKTTNTVEQLCQEFEAVVTNGKLSFKDLVFLTVNGQFKKYFDLLERFKELTGMDWKAMLDKLGDFGKGLSWEDVKEDVEKFGKNLATVGKNTGMNIWDDASRIGDVFKAGPAEIIKIYNGYKGMYNQLKDVKDVQGLLKRVVDLENPNWMSQIFDVSDYNINGYMTSYIKELQGTYKTQMYYIKRKSAGETVLLDYVPKEGMPKEGYRNDGPEKHGIPPTGWEEWLCEGPHEFTTTGDADFINRVNDGKGAHLLLNDQNLRENTMRITGWDYARMKQYEDDHPGHELHVDFSYLHHDYVNYKGHYKNHNRLDTYCFRAATERITDSFTADSILYEEMYDSQTMDYKTFMDKLERRKQGYEQQMQDKGDTDYGKGYTYVIEAGESRDYTVADEAKLKGVYSVTFLAQCKNSLSIGDGVFSWKENSRSQGSSITKKSQELAMMRKGESFTEEDISELTQKVSALNTEIEQLKSQQTRNDAQLQELWSKRNQAIMAGNDALASSYYRQWNDLNSQQAQLKSTISSKEAERNTYDSYIEQYYNDLSQESDNDYNRIPKYMDMYAGAYQIQWNDAGKWDENNTFTRLGYSQSGKFPVKFTAKLTLARKPSYFLGIRIHRPILQVEYSLTSDNPSQTVLESMDLDPDADPKVNEEKVNNRLKELLADYPDCDITLDYQKSQNVEADDDEDKIHLLFASDRLEVARGVLDKLVQINSQLMTMERLLYYKKTLKGFFGAILGALKDGSERGDIAHAAFLEWRNASLRAMEKQSPTYKSGSDGSTDSKTDSKEGS